MPGSTNVVVVSSGSFYAIDNGTLVETTTATIQASLRNVMIWVKDATLQADPTSTNVETSNNKSIHWLDMRNIILPQANNFIDRVLKSRYYTPFRKTEVSGTEYDEHLIQMASLYCAWRIQTRDFSGGGMPNDSQYSMTLRTLFNEKCNEILSGSLRLPGQRIKATNRFVNPNIEEILPGLKQGLDQISNQPESVRTSFQTTQ